MAKSSPLKLGDVPALLRVAEQTASPAEGAPVRADPASMRKLVAEFCKLLGTRAGKATCSLPVNVSIPREWSVDADSTLPRRLRQTLLCLLAGDSEKQIALRLKLSHHTVHAYIKALHKRYDVSSRGELLARFIPPQSMPPPS